MVRALEDERGGLVDRHGAGAGVRVRALAGVDGAGVEAELARAARRAAVRTGAVLAVLAVCCSGMLWLPLPLQVTVPGTEGLAHLPPGPGDPEPVISAESCQAPCALSSAISRSSASSWGTFFSTHSLPTYRLTLPGRAADVAEVGVGHLAGAVHDAAHDRDLHAGQVAGDVLDLVRDRLEVEQGPAARRAGDVLRLRDARAARLEHVEREPGRRPLVRAAHLDAVADAVAEQAAERHRGPQQPLVRAVRRRGRPDGAGRPVRPRARRAASSRYAADRRGCVRRRQIARAGGCDAVRRSLTAPSRAADSTACVHGRAVDARFQDQRPLAGRDGAQQRDRTARRPARPSGSTCASASGRRRAARRPASAAPPRSTVGASAASRAAEL